MITKLDNGVSKATNELPQLDPGEYALVNVSDATSREFWDFGVDEIAQKKTSAR